MTAMLKEIYPLWKEDELLGVAEIFRNYDCTPLLIKVNKHMYVQVEDPFLKPLENIKSNIFLHWECFI